MHSTLPLSLLALLPLVFAVDHPITVGADAKLAFNPSTVTAAVGDTLTFSYFPKNHSVVQSSFTDPCNPLANGFFSGFQPLSAGPGPVEFVVTVNDTKPIWIYCAQTKGSHCQMGMAMVINQPAPPSPNTLDAYIMAANKTGESTAPPAIAGGIFVSGNSTSTSGGSATGSSTGALTSSTGTSTGGSSDGSGSGSGSGSSNGGSNGSSSTTSSTSSTTSPITGFKGAAGRFVAPAACVSIIAGGVVFFALF